MNKVVKKGILNSTKGPNGGFCLNSGTLDTSLLTLIELTDGLAQFDGCVLRLRKCNEDHPCPLHYQTIDYKNNLLKTFSDTNIGSLLKQDKPHFIQSIAVI
jgi:Rrf2 family transcriptional regulator, iron-sulfur cluster assembly transcription factor